MSTADSSRFTSLKEVDGFFDVAQARPDGIDLTLGELRGVVAPGAPACREFVKQLHDIEAIVKLLTILLR
jgi:hypothetical protein